MTAEELEIYNKAQAITADYKNRAESLCAGASGDLIRAMRIVSPLFRRYKCVLTNELYSYRDRSRSILCVAQIKSYISRAG